MSKKFILERRVRGPDGMERSYLATNTEGQVYFTRNPGEADRFDTRAEAMRHPYKLYGLTPGLVLEIKETRT